MRWLPQYLLVILCVTLLTSCQEKKKDPSPTPPAEQNEISAIDAQIAKLKEEIKKLEEQSFALEAKAQEELFGNWDEFSKEVQKASDYQEKAIKLREKILELMLKKNQLLQQQ